MKRLIMTSAGQDTRVGDILELCHRDISPDRLTYLERKIGKTKNIPRHPRLNAVLARYPVPASSTCDAYLLPLLDHREAYAQPTEQTAEAQQRLTTLLKVIETHTALVNRYIKKAAKRAGIDKPLTSHSARHRFADAARVQLGGNVMAIKEILNHGQLRTTEIYLSDLETSELDAATLSVYGPSTTPVKQELNTPEQPMSKNEEDDTKTPLAA